ncbi:unnamed protein product [Phytophthora fragariaefolia]|uniref:Unnamed protein product n=1 Tax=Phytophthora fragariaefolia TaxID=1490495 RepID=A0A9W6YED1_9STRA|nr:unnamed protein product [Phytophthora fragariaefolia]
MNGNAPNAYKILEQVGRSMVATSAWMMMFGPKQVGGPKWVTLEKELSRPIDSSGLTQLAEQTKHLLEAMGFEYSAIPSKVSLQVWEVGDVSAELAKWKRKLKYSFGTRSSTTVRKLNGIDPNTVPAPSTPKKIRICPGYQTTSTKGEVFSKSAESPYSMGSHMVMPKKRLGGRRIYNGTDDDDDDDNAGRDYADSCEGLTAQTRRSYHHVDDDRAQ